MITQQEIIDKIKALNIPETVAIFFDLLVDELDSFVETIYDKILYPKSWFSVENKKRYMPEGFDEAMMKLIQQEIALKLAEDAIDSVDLNDTANFKLLKSIIRNNKKYDKLATKFTTLLNSVYSDEKYTKKINSIVFSENSLDVLCSKASERFDNYNENLKQEISALIESIDDDTIKAILSNNFIDETKKDLYKDFNTILRENITVLSKLPQDTQSLDVACELLKPKVIEKIKLVLENKLLVLDKNIKSANDELIQKTKEHDKEASVDLKMNTTHVSRVLETKQAMLDAKRKSDRLNHVKTKIDELKVTTEIHDEVERIYKQLTVIKVESDKIASPKDIRLDTGYIEPSCSPPYKTEIIYKAEKLDTLAKQKKELIRTGKINTQLSGVQLPGGQLSTTALEQYNVYYNHVKLEEDDIIQMAGKMDDNEPYNELAIPDVLYLEKNAKGETISRSEIKFTNKLNAIQVALEHARLALINYDPKSKVPICIKASGEFDPKFITKNEQGDMLYAAIMLLSQERCPNIKIKSLIPNHDTPDKGLLNNFFWNCKEDFIERHLGMMSHKERSQWQKNFSEEMLQLDVRQVNSSTLDGERIGINHSL